MPSPFFVHEPWGFRAWLGGIKTSEGWWQRISAVCPHEGFHLIKITGAFCERMNFPSLLLFYLWQRRHYSCFSVGFFLIHNIPPASFHTSQGASDHRYSTAASSHAASFILRWLPGCEGILTTPTSSECSRTGRATGRVCFQLSVLKRLTDVRRISCLWTSTSSVPSYSKHKQWVGRSEICSEPGCQNRNIFLKDKCQKKKKKGRCSCSL